VELAERKRRLRRELRERARPLAPARADEAARRTIQSLSRKVPEGSREWDVLYRKYVEEEMNRRRKI